MKNKYVPFLKMKVNEIGALSVLAQSIKEQITPFFDLPKEPDEKPDNLHIKIQKAVKSAEKHLKSFRQYYVDSFDVTDSIHINGRHIYYTVVEEFRNTPFIPVIGVDRKKDHNKAVFEGRRNGLIKSSCVALRLQPEDFSDYDLVQNEIEDLFIQCEGLFSEWDVVLDNRVCVNVDVNQRAKEITQFIEGLLGDYRLRRIVTTGSSIPAAIGDVIKTNTILDYGRVELDIFSLVTAEVKDSALYWGDYTIVSPLYSEVDIQPEAMRNVTAPKIAYSYERVHHLMRGTALASHPRGNQQYNDMAALLVTRPFFRPATYSFGEPFLLEKSKGLGAMVTPGSILKPTISTHITYMSRDYLF